MVCQGRAPQHGEEDGQSGVPSPKGVGSTKGPQGGPLKGVSPGAQERWVRPGAESGGAQSTGCWGDLITLRGIAPGVQGEGWGDGLFGLEGSGGGSAQGRPPRSAGRMDMRAADSGVLNPLGARGGPVKGVPAGAQGGRVRRGTQSRRVLDPQGAGGGPLKGVPRGAQGGRVRRGAGSGGALRTGCCGRSAQGRLLRRAAPVGAGGAQPAARSPQPLHQGRATLPTRQRTAPGGSLVTPPRPWGSPRPRRPFPHIRPAARPKPATANSSPLRARCV